MATTTDMHRTWRLDLRGKPEAVFVAVCPVVWARVVGIEGAAVAAPVLACGHGELK